MTQPQEAPALTADQAAVYDRQLRVWGLEVQNRLTSAKVLIIGGDGLAAEVAKNIVLAGVGHVALADDTPASAAPFGNFLVPADTGVDSTVAEASARTLAAMNPLIKVVAVPESQGGQSASEVVAPYDVVVTSRGLWGGHGAAALDAACAGVKKLFVVEGAGSVAYAYINLGPAHVYREKSAAVGADGQQPGPKTAVYPALASALSKPVSVCGGRRPVHGLYQVLRVVGAFEAAHRRLPGPSDGDALQALASDLEAKEGGAKGAISHTLLSEYVGSARAHLNPQDGPALAAATGPVAAVAGGVVANAVIRAISGVGAPLNNWFFYSLGDGAGVVEELAG